VNYALQLAYRLVVCTWEEGTGDMKVISVHVYVDISSENVFTKPLEPPVLEKT
jgi:hypothetical protein